MKTNSTLLVIIAYSLIIIIWSTTPLTIKRSSQDLHFISVWLCVCLLVSAWQCYYLCYGIKP